MRKFLKIFLRSLGTYLGLLGGLTRPSFIVGFHRLVILITYGMRNFTMEAVSLVCILATNLTSGTMWWTNEINKTRPLKVHFNSKGKIQMRKNLGLSYYRRDVSRIYIADSLAENPSQTSDPCPPKPPC